ncbi:MAG: CheB methylesterase domain-containing protein, partial [Pseudomonadota bacterium]
HDYLEGAAERIVGAVRQALRERGSASSQSAPPALAAALPRPLPKHGVRVELIAIGASAGGVEALHHLLPLLPADLPPVLVVQHIPSAFSAAFARRLDEVCELRVQLARDGDRLTRGRVLVGPGGVHLRVTRVGQQLLCRLDQSDPVKRHRPSVDALFTSLVPAVGAASVAVLLTGMGDDGVDGMLALRQAGATTIAQDEGSSVVYGMPREAARRGAAIEVLPLQRIAARLVALSNG